jgi:peptide deformylase
MAVRQILKMGHPALKLIAEPIDDPTLPEVSELARDMQDTLLDIRGNGLAAPQIDVGLRLVIYRVPVERIPAGAHQQPVPCTVMVNPVVTPLTVERRHIWERCLSLPGLYGKVPRLTRIRIAFETLEGEHVTREARGFHSMLLQHECDHLDGILYPMRMDDLSLLTFASEIFSEGDMVQYPPEEFDGT